MRRLSFFSAVMLILPLGFIAAGCDSSSNTPAPTPSAPPAAAPAPRASGKAAGTLTPTTTTEKQL